MPKFQKPMHNLEHGIFTGIGKYDIPPIQAMKREDFTGKTTFINFNRAVTVKKNRQDYSVHFFVDDYQFERCWNSLDVYTKMMLQFNYVMAPDFSIYVDTPRAMQVWNHYRKHYVAAWWQIHGVKLIPTIRWGDKSSWEWCFDGEPENSVVAVGTVGLLKEDWLRRLYLDGYKEMIRRLNPSLIISYGHLPPELMDDNVMVVKPFYESVKKRAKLQKNVKKAFKEKER